MQLQHAIDMRGRQHIPGENEARECRSKPCIFLEWANKPASPPHLSTKSWDSDSGPTLLGWVLIGSYPLMACGATISIMTGLGPPPEPDNWYFVTADYTDL